MDDGFIVSPLGAPLVGSGTVPGDKSISHRAVLFAAMAEGVSHVEGVLDSADVRSSIGAVSLLGANVLLDPQEDGSLAGTIEGWGARGPQPEREDPGFSLFGGDDDEEDDFVIDCGNSGTTTRLLMGILAPWECAVTLTGDESLQTRPMKRITGPLSAMGATFNPEDRHTLPLNVQGSEHLMPLDFQSPVASAQLKSAILLAGIFAEGTTRVEEPAPSRNHTELMLGGFGVEVDHGPGWAEITGPQAVEACDVKVPGDPSSAAFPLCAAVMKEGSDLTVEGVSLNSGRIGFVDVLRRMGADVAVTQEQMTGGEPCGSIRARHTSALSAVEVAADEIASMVDEIPVLALVAARAQGETVFRGVSELRVKECDRLAAIIEGLGMIGVRAWAQDDDLHIEGNPDLAFDKPLSFESHHDHRLAMTWALVGMTGSAPVEISDFECVNISYPTFLDDMRTFSAFE